MTTKTPPTTAQKKAATKKSTDTEKKAARKRLGKSDRRKMFLFYAELGRTRTLQKVADKFGYHINSMKKISAEEGWIELLTKLQEEADEEAERKLQEETEITLLEVKRIEKLAILKSGELLTKAKNQFEIESAWRMARVHQNKPTTCTRLENVAEGEVSARDFEEEEERQLAEEKAKKNVAK